MYDVCARPWLYYVKPVKIIGNLYYIGNKDVSVHLNRRRRQPICGQ